MIAVVVPVVALTDRVDDARDPRRSGIVSRSDGRSRGLSGTIQETDGSVPAVTSLKKTSCWRCWSSIRARCAPASIASKAFQSAPVSVGLGRRVVLPRDALRVEQIAQSSSRSCTGTALCDTDLAPSCRSKKQRRLRSGRRVATPGLRRRKVDQALRLGLVDESSLPRSDLDAR